MFFISCEFEPSDVIFKQVKPPTAPNVIVNLPFEKDTVYITGNADVNFGFFCSGHKIYKISFTLDSDEIYKSSGDSLITGQIDFDYNFMQEGIFKLQMISIVDSKSGSIADKVGAEAYSFTKTWTLIYKKVPDKPKISFIGPDNGRLKVVWEKSKSFSFQEYKVRVGVFDYNLNSFEFQDMATLKDVDNSFFIDSTYIGGTFKYTISVKEGDALNLDTISYTGKNIGFDIQTDKYLNCVFRWNKTAFYNNFGNTKIVYLNLSDTSYSSNYQTLTQTSNFNDTSFTIKDGLISNRRYYLYVNPKLEKNYFTTNGGLRLKKDHYSAGETFFPCDQLCFAAVSPYNIYGKNTNSLFKYSAANGNFFSQNLTAKYGMAVSLNDKYLVCGEYKVDPSTLMVQSMNIQNQMGFSNFFNHPAISDSGIFVGETINDEKGVYDVENKKPLQVIQSIYQIFNPNVSPNGQYVVMNGDYYPRIEIWKYKADSAKSNKYFELYYQHGNYKNKHITYMQTNTESKFYIANGNSIELWSCEQLKVIQSYITDATDVIQIDPVTKNIVAYKPGHLLIYKSDDFSLLWDIGIDPSYGDNWNNYIPEQFVVVNSVIYKNGKQLDLKKYEKVY